MQSGLPMTVHSWARGACRRAPPSYLSALVPETPMWGFSVHPTALTQQSRFRVWELGFRAQGLGFRA